MVFRWGEGVSKLGGVRPGIPIRGISAGQSVPDGWGIVAEQITAGRVVRVGPVGQQPDPVRRLRAPCWVSREQRNQLRVSRTDRGLQQEHRTHPVVARAWILVSTRLGTGQRVIAGSGPELCNSVVHP